MRFDEFVRGTGVPVFPTDRFAGFIVQTGMPGGWEPHRCGLGIRIWVCAAEPLDVGFRANVVLTMHQVEAVLDGREAFSMLSDQQVDSTTGCRELHRQTGDATEGPGIEGTLALQTTLEFGTVDSLSRTRVITTERETLIAQLTVTELRDSPRRQGGMWMTVRRTTDSGTAARHSSVSVARKVEGS